ncbi:LysR substrate-binding domain-containing protein [Pseudoxanthomonas sp. UTMC 1351]|uniref:LysR substrate-binding domain-containing protein n=1 Tax=Pseudoxanthomonas sp. UTMC 1351 TaxID=2695853 RepID=UPI0034CE8A5D
MTTLPPLDGLTAVLAAIRAGSFTAAADELGLTHGAVSRRIQSVERWLGTPLFERHARGVRATPAGQRFAREVEQALATISQSAEHWRPRRELETVRISVVPSFAKLWLLPRLRALQGAPAELRIELLVEHRLVNLEGREADLAIRYGAGVWPGLRTHLLMRETLFPVAAADIAQRLGPRASAERIAQEPLLHDSDTTQWRAWLQSCGQRYRPRARDRRFEDYDLVLAAAEAGLGIALLRAPLAVSALASGRLVPVSDHVIHNKASHWIVTRADEDRSSVLRLIERMSSESS